MRGMQAVVSAAQQPEARAGLLEAFVSSHDRLFGYVARRLGPDAAEDVVAETFARACAQWAGYDPALGGVTAWLFGITANLLTSPSA